MSVPAAPEGDRVIMAVASAARVLAHTPSWAEALPDVLEELAHATGARHACACENVEDDDGRVWMLRRAVWSEPSPARPVEVWGERHAYEDGYARWATMLGRGEPIHGVVDSLPEAERTHLASHGVGSVLVVPVDRLHEWWGSLILAHDDEHPWTGGERAALTAVAQMLGAAVDREEQARLLHETERRHRAHIESIPAITYIEDVDPDEPAGYGEVYVSPQVETMLGYTPETWLADGGHWQRVIHPDDYQRVWDESARTTETGEPFMEEYRVRTAWDEWKWVRDESQLVLDDGGKPVFWHGVLTDVTARKEAEAQVAFLAYHDPLTGLANRALFEEMLEAALARARRAGSAVAVLFGDLDGFKDVNDTLGHHAGDVLLRAIADRLEPITRDTDVIARQGGDEFLVLMSDLPVEDGERFGAVATARMMADRIRASLQEPFAIAGTEVTTSMSIGSSIYPLEADDMRSLLARADAAMYEGKRSNGRIDLERRDAG
ncbi:MAG: diguanylate cyclase [Actinomycetota bacterium]